MSDRRDRDDDEDTGRRRSSRDEDERGARGFKYRPRSADDARARAERNTYGGDPYLKEDVRMFKPATGDNTVRVLPATWEDARHYGIDVFLHFGIGADRNSYLCLEKMKNKACPICEARKRANTEGDQEFADQLRPQSRVLLYLLNRDKERDGALVWSMSARQDADITRLALDKKTGEALNVDDPEDGYDLTFTREGEGMKTRYSGFAFSRRSSALDSDKALEFAIEHPLPDQLVFYSYDHIAQAFAGTKPRDDDDDGKDKRRSARDEDKPARRENKDEDDKSMRREKRKPEVDVTWDEVHEMKFSKLAALIDEHELDIDAEASRNDAELADDVCAALGIEKRAARRGRDEDDATPVRRSVREQDDDAPVRRKLREARDRE